MTERTMPSTVTLLCCAVLTLVSGCFETRTLPAVIPGTGTTMALIGAEGGSVMVDDLLVTFPAGAVTTDTEIAVTVAAPTGPSAFTLFSPIITFEPAGLVLARPVEIRIPFRGDGRIASVYTAQSGGGAFVPRPTQIVGDVAIAHIDYLASTFVGSACEGDDCACEPNGELDLLVVIDNSASMAEEQELIRAQLPILLGRLAIGDSDGDTIQDVAAFGSIRVGFVTSDMGTGPVSGIVSCAEGFGDDGILVDGHRGTSAACLPFSATRIAEYSAGNPLGLSDFVVQVGCMGEQGIDGCGFEQQLEAALVALSPNMATGYTDSSWSIPSYADGRMGQGDLANAGFLRDDSILAVLWVTDEEDCSTTDSLIFDRTDPRYSSIDLNLRCFSFPEVLQPVERFVAGIVGLRRRPEDVVVAAITGTPSGLGSTPGAIDYDGILAHPAMEETVDPVLMNRLRSSCSSTNGTAYPPRRIVRTLQGIDESGARVVLQSICDPSFDELTQDLASQLGERASGGC